MTEERLATALDRASNAAQRIEEAIASLAIVDARTGVEDSAATIKAAIAPILTELDAMIADAERGQR